MNCKKIRPDLYASTIARFKDAEMMEGKKVWRGSSVISTRFQPAASCFKLKIEETKEQRGQRQKQDKVGRRKMSERRAVKKDSKNRRNDVILGNAIPGPGLQAGNVKKIEKRKEREREREKERNKERTKRISLM